MSNVPSVRTGGTANPPPAVTVRRGVKAVVSSSSRVLLVQERHADGSAFWTLPGGGVDPHESLVEGLRRELSEELRCDPAVEDAVSTFWYAHRSSPRLLSHYTVFSCLLATEVRPVRGEGILDSAWIPPEDPPASTLPQVRYLLRAVRSHSGDRPPTIRRRRR